MRSRLASETRHAPKIDIREAIGPRLPAAAPCDTYGPQDAIETVGGALRDREVFIACSRPHRNAVAVPAPVVVFEIVSPGPDNRRRDEEKVNENESVLSILRYVVVESEGRSFRAGRLLPAWTVIRRYMPPSIRSAPQLRISRTDRAAVVPYPRPAIERQAQWSVEIDDLGLLRDEQRRRDPK